MKVNIKKLHPDAVIPAYAKPRDALIIAKHAEQLIRKAERKTNFNL